MKRVFHSAPVSWVRLLIVGCCSVAVVASTPFPWTWRWSHPLPHGNNIFDLAFRDGLYVQIAERGQIFTSTDLLTWAPRGGQTTRALRSLEFYNGQWVIVGESATVLLGNPDQDLRLVDLGTSDWLEGVAASPNQLVAVGDRAAIYTSLHGQDWIRRTPPFTNWLRSVTYGTPGGSGLFVTVGESGLIASSSDGAIWQRRTSPTAQNLNRVAWQNGQFRVVGNGGLYLTSANGATWQIVNSGATNDLNDLAAAPNSLLLAGTSELRLQEGASPWSSEIDNAQSFKAPAWSYLSAIWDGVSFLAGGRTGLLMEGFKTNDTGRTFWLPLVESPRDWLWAVKRFPEVYLAVGDRGTLMSSVEGVDWDLEFPPDSARQSIFLGIGGRTNLAVAAGNAGTLILSPDERRMVTSTNANGTVTTNEVSTLGILWQAVNPRPTNQDLQGVAALGDLLIVTGGGGTILTSRDGAQWTPRASSVTAFLSSVEAFPGGAVAVGSDGTILTSLDGLSWTRRVSPAPDWIYRVRYLNGKLLACGQNGLLLSSVNGQSWQKLNSGTTRWLNDLAFIDGTYVAVGTQGTVLASTNAVDWIEIGTATQKSLFGAATDGKQLVVVGIEGIILRSQIIPPSSPVQILEFPTKSSENVFLFSGEIDQRFTLERSTNLIDWSAGPTLEIYDRSGTLLHLDEGLNHPQHQFFRTQNRP